MGHETTWRCEHLPTGDVKTAAKVEHKLKLEEDGYVCEVYVDPDWSKEPIPQPDTRPSIPLRPPTVNFAFEVEGLDVRFTDLSEDLVGLSGWLWDFGDGATSTFRNPDHLYQVEDTYVVTLTVYNEDGISSETSISVEV